MSSPVETPAGVAPSSPVITSSTPATDAPAAVDSTTTTDSSSSSELPAATPSLGTAKSSYIDVDTSTAQHVPHVEPKPTGSSSSPKVGPAAAAAVPEEDELDDGVDSEPLSEVDDGDTLEDEDPAEHAERVKAFLHAIHHPLDGANNGAAPSSSAEDETFSESEHAFGSGGFGSPRAGATPSEAEASAQAAVTEVQEFLNRQAAAHAKKVAAAEAAAAAASPRSSSSAAADRAARKAAFAAQVEARRRAQFGASAEDEHDEDEAEEQAEKPASNNRQQRGAVEDEEEEEEEEEEEVDATFFGWVKTRASDVWHGRRAKQLQSGSKWLTYTALEWSGKALYVAGTLALVLIPFVAANEAEQASLLRQARIQKSPLLTEELKVHLLTGMEVKDFAPPSIDKMSITQ